MCACGQKMKNEEDLDNNLEAAHITFKCSICGKNVPVDESLAHMNLHQTQDSYRRVITEGKRKPNNLGYLLFLKEKKTEIRRINPGIRHQLATSQISNMWKGMSKKQKQVYEVRAVQDQLEDPSSQGDLQEQNVGEGIDFRTRPGAVQDQRGRNGGVQTDVRQDEENSLRAGRVAVQDQTAGQVAVQDQTAGVQQEEDIPLQDQEPDPLAGLLQDPLLDDPELADLLRGSTMDKLELDVRWDTALTTRSGAEQDQRERDAGGATGGDLNTQEHNLGAKPKKQKQRLQVIHVRKKHD